MGDRELGLVFTIDADSSGAQQSLQAFGNQTTEAFSGATQSLEPFNKSLLNQHQTVHLLAEEMGIRLPRAVVSGISEMLPNIASLGTGLLAAFAVEELIKFGEHLHKLADISNGVTEAEKELNAAGKENVSILEEQAKKSLDYARSQVMLLLIQAAAADAAVDKQRKAQEVLPPWEKAVLQVALAFGTMGNSLLFTEQTNKAVGVAQRFYLGQSKELTNALEDQKDMTKLLDSVVKILGEDEDKAAKKAARSWEESSEQAYEYFAKRRKQGEEEFNHYVALSTKIMAAQERTREMQQQVDAHLQLEKARSEHQRDEEEARNEEKIVDMAAANFRELQRHAKELRIEWANAHPLAANIIQDLKSMGIEAKSTSVAKLELTAITHQFAQAATEEVMAVQKNIAASGEQLAAGLAGLIGGRRAQAGVEAVWNVAQGIACLAEGTWPPNPAAIIAAGLHFEAAAQYALVAGSGGGGSRARGGAGGGTHSSYERSGGSGGERGGSQGIERGGGSRGGGSSEGGQTIVQIQGRLNSNGQQQMAAWIGMGSTVGLYKFTASGSSGIAASRY